LGGGHRAAPGGGGEVVPLPLPVEEDPHGPGQLPGVGIETGDGGVVDGGKQNRMLDGEPVQGLPVVGGMFRDDPGTGCGWGDRVSGRV